MHSWSGGRPRPGFLLGEEGRMEVREVPHESGVGLLRGARRRWYLLGQPNGKR